MRRWKVAVLMALICTTAGGRLAARPQETEAAERAVETGTRSSGQGYVTMFRLYHPVTREHFYTASAHERDVLTGRGWKDEGVGWYAPEYSETPVYRLYHPAIRDHHYTTSAQERDVLSSNCGWQIEGIGWDSDDAKTVPLYRRYCPRLTSGAHHYTTSFGEAQHLLSVGWKDEGVGWYGIKPGDTGMKKGEQSEEMKRSVDTCPNGDGESAADSAGCADQTYTIVLVDGTSVSIIGHYDDAAAEKLTSEIISYRKKYGLETQRVSDSLAEGAKVRAVEVCAVKSHIRPDGTDCITVSREALSESFMNYGESPEEILAAWKASPSHNGNLLQAANQRIGVGVFARRISNGDKDEYRYSAVVLQG